MTNGVAIDFGTTRTKLAYLDGNRPQLMRFEGDRAHAPSLFYLQRGGAGIAWGFDAQAMLHADPAGVIDVPKRRLRERQLRANGRAEPPVRLLATMLADLRQRVGEEVTVFAGRPPSRVVLTAPALYGPVEEAVLRQAAVAAGFDQAAIELVPEPVAAARAWLAETGERVDEVVVLDCGGGTVDWAYLRREGNDLRVVVTCPPGGDQHVGGHDVDLELLELVRDRLDDPAAVAELEAQRVHYLGEVRELKERFGRGLPLGQFRVAGRGLTLEEAEVRQAIEERFIAQVCSGLADYLRSVEREARRVPPVLLVGGSARLKGLKEVLEQRLGRTTLRWERAEFATVLGALAQSPTSEREISPARKVLRAPRKTMLPAKVVRELAMPQSIRSVVYSGDGRLLAAAGFDGLISLWQAASNEQLLELNLSTKPSVVALSRSGRLLAAGGKEAVRLWDLEAKRELCVLDDIDDWILGLDFSPDERWLAVASTLRGFHLWDGATSSLALSDTEVDCSCLVFSPEGELLALSDGEQICIRDAGGQNERCRLVGHIGKVDCIRFSPDSRILASTSSDDHTLRLWDLEKVEEICLIDLQDGAIAIDFSTDGEILAVGTLNGSIIFWDMHGQRVKSLNGSHSHIYSIAFSPDGQFFASAGEENAVKLWSCKPLAAAERRLSAHDELGAWPHRLQRTLAVPHKPSSITFSPDGRLLAVSLDSYPRKDVALLDVATSSELAVFAGHTSNIATITFSPDGRFLASGGGFLRYSDREPGDCAIRLWDVRRGKLVRKLEGHSAGVTQIAFSPDSRLLASVSYDRSLRLWDVQNGKQQRVIEDKHWLTTVAFSAKGELAFAGYNALIELIDPAGGGRADLFVGHTKAILRIAFSPDGRLLASGSLDRTVRLWDIDEGEEICVLGEHGKDVSGVVFSPDGRLLASASWDGAIVFWDVALHQELGRMTAPGNKVNSIAFSPDGRLLASAGDLKGICLWG